MLTYCQTKVYLHTFILFLLYILTCFIIDSEQNDGHPPPVDNAHPVNNAMQFDDNGDLSRPGQRSQKKPKMREASTQTSKTRGTRSVSIQCQLDAGVGHGMPGLPEPHRPLPHDESGGPSGPANDGHCSPADDQLPVFGIVRFSSENNHQLIPLFVKQTQSIPVNVQNLKTVRMSHKRIGITLAVHQMKIALRVHRQQKRIVYLAISLFWRTRGFW